MLDKDGVMSGSFLKNLFLKVTLTYGWADLGLQHHIGLAVIVIFDLISTAETSCLDLLLGILMSGLPLAASCQDLWVLF